MPDLVGVELMMERSKEHLDAFQHEVRMFLMGAKPYALITEKDPEGEGYIVRAKCPVSDFLRQS